MINPEALTEALSEYLPRQRWFSGADAAVPELRLKSVEPLRIEWPALLQVLVEARLPVDGQMRTATYQVVLGLRPVDSRQAFLEGKPEAILCELDTDLGAALAYDALIDPELAVTLLQVVAPGEEAGRARYLGADQSNTSVVFDERLIMKLFRRVPEGPNPDAEITRALVEVGFTNVARPVAEWRGMLATSPWSTSSWWAAPKGSAWR